MKITRPARSLTTILAFLLVPTSLTLCPARAAKRRDWKIGTLLETAHALQRQPPVKMFGTLPDPAAQGPSFSLGGPTAWVGLRIQADSLVLEVMCAAKSGHTPDVTVNGSVHYMIEKGKFYLLDDSGKEWEMTILEKTLVPAAPKKE